MLWPPSQWIRNRAQKHNNMGQIQTLQTDYLRKGAEQISYKRFSSDGIYVETIDENILMKCPTDIQPVNQDLTRQYERPLKTAEFITDLNGDYIVNENAHFMYGSHRYITANGSTSFSGKTGGTTLEFISDDDQTAKAVSGGKYFRTDISVNSTGDLVQMISNDREYTVIEPFNDIKVEFDYYIKTTSTEETWDIPIRAFLQENTYSSGGTIDAYYDFINGEWKSSDDDYQAKRETTTINAWGKKSVTLNGYISTDAQGDVDNSVTALYVTVSIGYPMSKGGVAANMSDFYLDNFRISESFDVEDTIVSRRSQHGFNGNFTAKYKSEGNALSNEGKSQEYFLGKIEGDYKRPRDTVNKSIEQIITQEILNDNRNFLRRYEGTFIAQSETHLGLHHKIWVDFGDDQLQEPVTCYIDAMKYDVKGAEYSIRMHLPNQDDDVGSTYNVFVE